MTGQPKPPPLPAALLEDLRSLIIVARQSVAQTVNSALVMLYWKMGDRISRDLLKGRRAGYGEEIVATVSRRLVDEFGTGFTEKNLRHMMRFAEVFPDEQIVYALSRQLGWTHFRHIIYLDAPLKRDFYAEMCRIERWSTRTLEQKIGGMLYERTALSKKPEQVAKQELDALREEDKLTPDLVFRDPYLLDFLGLKDAYSEKDLEAAILREIESFILELGAGFTFVERQKRITVGDDDFYLDLLFYHRKLRRLVAIELKLDKFKPAYKGQMELYLRWLEKYEQEPDEQAPIGLILCASKSDEQIELLRIEGSKIRVSTYMTELPPKQLLRERLHRAIIAAKTRLAAITQGAEKE
jgi:predicted nuclease of restriction endonuclease-like (RecB) superfamily